MEAVKLSLSIFFTPIKSYTPTVSPACLSRVMVMLKLPLFMWITNSGSLLPKDLL